MVASCPGSGTAEINFHGGKELERALKELGGNIAGLLGGNAARAGARVIARSPRDGLAVDYRTCPAGTPCGRGDHAGEKSLRRPLRSCAECEGGRVRSTGAAHYWYQVGPPEDLLMQVNRMAVSTEFH